MAVAVQVPRERRQPLVVWISIPDVHAVAQCTVPRVRRTDDTPSTVVT